MPDSICWANDSACRGNKVSAHHTARTCFGSINTSYGSYRMGLFGGQCWMIDNLREPPTKFGFDSLNRGWNDLQKPFKGDQGFYGYYSEETRSQPSWDQNADSSGEGLLYQWSVAMNGSNSMNNRGVCPEGWHIPSDCEWMFLEQFLSESAHGAPMEELLSTASTMDSSYVVSPNMSDNAALFDVFPGGFRSVNGIFYQMGSHAYFWSSSAASEQSAYYRVFITHSKRIFRAPVDKAYAFPVRCIKD